MNDSHDRYIVGPAGAGVGPQSKARGREVNVRQLAVDAKTRMSESRYQVLLVTSIKYSRDTDNIEAQGEGGHCGFPMPCLLLIIADAQTKAPVESLHLPATHAR